MNIVLKELATHLFGSLLDELESDATKIPVLKDVLTSVRDRLNKLLPAGK